MQPEDLTDIQTTDYICQELSGNSNTSYYSTLEFADTVKAQNIQNNKLSFIHINIRSIKNKFDMFKHLLDSLTYKLSVIALTETWLDDNDCSDSFVIPGYNLHMINKKHKAGGGICVFPKENLNVRLRNDINIISNNETIESLFIEIVSEKNKNIVIGTIYRPPNSNFNDFENNLKTILSNLDKCNKPCYIMGDFNIY